MIKYHRLLYPSQDVSNLSYDELFFKLHGITHETFLKNQEELEKKIDRYEHERIKYRERILKKNNVKSIQGEFLQQLNIFQSLFKHKKGKRIMVLNLFIDNLDINSVMLDYGITIKRLDNEELLIKFDKKVPLIFEMDYFSLKIKKEKKQIKPQLKIFQDIEKSSKKISSDLKEISPKLKRVLSLR